jgi:hypothetical protein
VATADAGPPAGLGVDANITFIGDRDLTPYTGLQAYTGYGGWAYEYYIGTTGRSAELTTLAAHGRDKTCTGSVWTQGGNSWTIEYVDTNVIKFYSVTKSLTLPSGGGTMVNASGVCNDTGDIVYTSAEASTLSPFWNEADDEFNFVEWQARNGTIDVAYVLLGWNSVSAPDQTDWTAEMADVRTFLDQLIIDSPDVTYRIIGIQVPSPTGGLGANYLSNSPYSQYYGVLRSANNLNAAYQDLANESDYSSYVEFIGMMPQFDAEFNYPSAATPVNTRSAITELRGTNGLHPLTDGYEQIADSVFRKFVFDFLE